MKKFMKGCAIMAAILIALGAILAIIGGAMRGSELVSAVVDKVTGGRVHINSTWPWNWNRSHNGWEINVGGWDISLGDILDWGDGAYESSHEVHLGDISDGIVSGSDVNSLDIELGGCLFETRISEDGDFHLETSGIDRIQSYVEQGKLYIKSVKTSLFLGSSASKITLYVPEGQHYDRVDIDLGAGEIVIDGLSAVEVSLEVGAGQIKVKNLKAKVLEAEVGMGQIELPDMDVDQLEAEVGMGELAGSGSINVRALLECSMGNLELKLIGSQQDFNYRLDAAAGNIDLGRDSFGGLAQTRRIDNGAAKTIEADCSMGNITISFKQ